MKVDHCEYFYITNAVTNCRIAPLTDGVHPDASQCIEDCKKNNGCTGVQLTRVKNPEGTLGYTPNIPFTAYNDPPTAAPMKTAAPPGPCEYISVDRRAKAGCKNVHPKCNITALAPKDDDYICYGLNPSRDINLQVQDDFSIVTEPSDPKFYSTCWVRVVNGGFLPTLVDPIIPKPYFVVLKCILFQYMECGRKMFKL